MYPLWDNLIMKYLFLETTKTKRNLESVSNLKFVVLLWQVLPNVENSFDDIDDVLSNVDIDNTFTNVNTDSK